MTTLYMCECGFATDDRDWLDGHLWEHPGHDERVPFWSRVLIQRGQTAVR